MGKGRQLKPIEIDQKGITLAGGFTIVMVRRSQLQREVLKLYRRFMEVCRSKPLETKQIVRETFKKNAAIKRTDTIMIEYLLRRGRKQLRTLEQSDGLSTFRTQ